MTIKVGDYAKIDGLVKAVHFNGLMARVVQGPTTEASNDNARYGVVLLRPSWKDPTTGEDHFRCDVISVKRENLIRMEPEVGEKEEEMVRKERFEGRAF